MKRSRMFVLALFSLTFSFLVAFLAYRVFQSRLTTETSQMVVAAEKLSLGQRVNADHMRTVAWPLAAPLEGSFANPEELVGRGVIVPMARNEPILESNLAPVGGGFGLAAAIPEGMRAVAVRVDEVSRVAGFVLPGTRVDVILTGSADVENRRYSDTSKVILENVQVLTAGTNLEQEEGGEAMEVTVVTLLVTPRDAQKLALAAAHGRIQLALRNPLDLEQENPLAVQQWELYRGPTTLGPQSPPATDENSAARPVAKPVVPTAFTVELIQGDERETWTFDRAQP